MAATPVQWAPITFDAKRVDIEYVWVGSTDGAAPVLVFLHEGLGSRSMWRDYPQQLCDAVGMRGLVLSRYGYGQSTQRPVDEEWQPDFMHRQAREALPALLGALGLWNKARPVYLFGHSDGASIALLMASFFPQHVAATVSLAAHLFAEDLSIASITAVTAAYRTTDLRERLARHHANPDSAFWGWSNAWLRPVFRNWNIEREVAGISGPLLAVQGVDDEYGTVAQTDSIQRLVPHAAVHLLPACGHSPHRDQPERLTALVRAWLTASRQPRVFSS